MQWNPAKPLPTTRTVGRRADAVPSGEVMGT
jgi:hypothetical protein